jgi:hypothetical protein
VNSPDFFDRFALSSKKNPSLRKVSLGNKSEKAVAGLSF